MSWVGLFWVFLAYLSVGGTGVADSLDVSFTCGKSVSDTTASVCASLRCDAFQEDMISRFLLFGEFPNPVPKEPPSPRLRQRFVEQVPLACKQHVDTSMGFSITLDAKTDQTRPLTVSLTPSAGPHAGNELSIDIPVLYTESYVDLASAVVSQVQGDARNDIKTLQSSLDADAEYRRRRICDLKLSGSVSFASQYGQDAWVALEVYGRQKTAGYFVEIGASDGIFLSNTFALERGLGWHGLCIEAGEVGGWIAQNRPRCIPVIAAVAGVGGQPVYIDRSVGASSLEYSTRPVTRDKNDEQRLLTRTMESILSEVEAPRLIDYMSVDIEGGELDVLMTFPFNRYTVGAITVEHNDNFIRRDAIFNLLKLHGFARVGGSGMDDFYLHHTVTPMITTTSVSVSDTSTSTKNKPNNEDVRESTKTQKKKKKRQKKKKKEEEEEEKA